MDRMRREEENNSQHELNCSLPSIIFIKAAAGEGGGLNIYDSFNRRGCEIVLDARTAALLQVRKRRPKVSKMVATNSPQTIKGGGCSLHVAAQTQG